jgi:hypothetical protein
VKKLPFLLVLLMATPALVFADEIFLKGAGSFSGRITQESDAVVMIETGDGTIGVPRERIHHIVKGRSPLDEYEDRAKKLKLDDANGWRELGRWAAHAGISTQSRAAYEKVIKVAPNDAEAREALGFVQLDGRWVTEEESYRARGFVRYQGEWMTPAEVQVHETTQANEQATRDAEQRAIDAEVAQVKAEQKAEEERKRAEEAEEEANRYSNPIYWGGYGYGVGYWPSGNATVNYHGRSISR